MAVLDDVRPHSDHALAVHYSYVCILGKLPLMEKDVEKDVGNDCDVRCRERPTPVVVRVKY